LIGRDSELERVRGARSAGATGVMISGEAGVGKTRIARQAVKEAGDAGLHMAWVRATHSSCAIPLGALSALVPSGMHLEGDAGFVGAIVSELREQADDREIVLGVDDAQLLDPASATVLLHVAEHFVAFVVATVRAGEPCPDAVTALWKDAGAVRVEVGSLEDSVLAELIEAVLDGPVERDTQRWLARTSEGNVLYAQQLLAGALESGALTREEAAWRLTERPKPSSSLRELVAARMGSLTEGERCGLELLALAEPLGSRETEELIGAEMLAALECCGVAVIDATAEGAGEVRVAHPLYGELISTETPVLRGHSHRARLAHLVSARPEPSPSDRVRVARWLTEAGEPVPADMILEAAKAANMAGSESGTEFAERALRSGAGPEASIVLAVAHAVHGRPTEAEATLAGLEGEIADRALAFRYLLSRATALQWGLGRGADAVALLDRALAWWPDERWQRQVGLLRLQFAALIGQPGLMAPRLEEALADGALDEEARRGLIRTLAVDRFWAGRVQEAHALLPEAPRVPLRGELDVLELASSSVIGLASGCDLSGLEREMRGIFERAADAADPAAAGLAAVTVAASSFLAGRFLDCRRWLNEAMAQSRRQDPSGVSLVTRSLQVGASLALGDHRGAAAAGSHLEEEVLDRTAGQRGVGAWIARGRAWGRLAEADPSSAQALLLEEAGEFAWAPVFAAELHYEAMRSGRPARELSPALTELRERCDAPLTQAYAAHAAARAHGNPSAMLEATDSFAALGAALYASEAAAHAAAAFASEGREDSARRAAARSRELRPAGQGAAPMSIEGVDQAAIELTPREAQMVELASRGLTNAEIAEQLVLSTRTVETHIYRAMRKLGVSDRRAFRSQVV
jgi:DNA-binding CsgD family transcriptional regulator